MLLDNRCMSRQMSIRESAKALMAEWDGGNASEATMAPLFEALQASIDGSPTKPGDLPDVTLALATIDAMKAGQPIAPGGVQAVVALAEIGFEQLEQFDIRWSADMRAIERWRAGDTLPAAARSLLVEVAESLRLEETEGAGDGSPSHADRIECLLLGEERVCRALTLPDHADLVVWLMDGLDAPFDGPTIAEVETMQARLKAEHDRSGKAVNHEANALLGQMAEALRTMARRAFVAEQAAANSLPVLDMGPLINASAVPANDIRNADHPAVAAAIKSGLIEDGAIWPQPGQGGLAIARQLKELTGLAIKSRSAPQNG